MSRAVRILTSLPVRAAVTIALLTALAAWIDWGAFFRRLEQGRWDLFAVAVLLVVLAILIGALRWHVFLSASDVQVTFPQTLRAYGIGMFANNFLPTGFGGDAARALVIAPAAPSTGRAVASVFVDRVTALACLVLLAWFAVAVEPDSVPGSLIGLLAFATALGLAGALALAFLARRSHRATHATFLQRLIAPLALMWVEIRDRGKLRSVALRTTTLGLAYQATMVLASWVLARAIDLDLSFALLAVVTPLVILVTLFPISIAGLGVREGGYVTLLAEAGVSAPDATLLSLLTVAALAIATLPGAVGLLLPAVTQHDRRDPAPS